MEGGYVGCKAKGLDQPSRSLVLLRAADLPAGHVKILPRPCPQILVSKNGFCGSRLGPEKVFLNTPEDSYPWVSFKNLGEYR